jgi:hypothetical protein
MEQDTAWSLPVASYLVIVMGVQTYEGKEHRYVDYPVMDVLQMMGCACHLLEDEQSCCVLMYQQTRSNCIFRHIFYMITWLRLVKMIENKQDVMVTCLFKIFPMVLLILMRNTKRTFRCGCTSIGR